MALKRTSGEPTVVLVGRPNVGKSTLFNRITGSRRAIVTPIAGTTRDVNALPAEWRGHTFRLVDTGGLFGASEDPLHELVVQHGRKAVERADVLIFVVDGREGLVPGDEEIARSLRSASVPVLLAVNKTDDKRARGDRSSSTRWASSRWSRLPPSTAKGLAICSTKWWAACRNGARG
jgi:GTP-binding protein